MKKIRSISISALFVLTLVTAVAAKVNTVAATVQNNTTENLGTVAIYSAGTPYYVNVSGKGEFSVNVPSTPTSVVVNSYVVLQGQYGIVTLPSGLKAKVTLSGSGIIVVPDTIQVN